MTTLLATRAPSLFEWQGGEPTLDAVVAGVWEGLTAHAPVDCPLCGEAMEPQRDQPRGSLVGPRGSLVGTCVGCGSQLS